MRVLFVCTGNICRSPTADGILRHLWREKKESWQVDSAATHAYHLGAPPDARSIAEAKKYGVDLSPLRARLIRTEDAHAFDLILAMGQEHLETLHRILPPSPATVALFSAYTGINGARDIEDPYYGDAALFTHVYQRIAAGCESLTKNI